MLYKYMIISLIKLLQKNGNGESSELIIKQAFCIIKKTTKDIPFLLIKKALNNSKPFCEIKSVRISGTNYKVPVGIKVERQKALVFRWLILNALKRSDLSLAHNLAKELIDTANFIGKTIKMCDDFHKAAESNKIYIQYRN